MLLMVVVVADDDAGIARGRSWDHHSDEKKGITNTIKSTMFSVTTNK